MVNLKMEDKLNELKEKFCKYNCENKNKTIELESGSSCGGFTYCDECNSAISCDDYIENEIVEFEPCEYCKVQEFINYIRDEIK